MRTQVRSQVGTQMRIEVGAQVRIRVGAQVRVRGLQGSEEGSDVVMGAAEKPVLPSVTLFLEGGVQFPHPISEGIAPFFIGLMPGFLPRGPNGAAVLP